MSAAQSTSATCPWSESLRHRQARPIQGADKDPSGAEERTALHATDLATLAVLGIVHEGFGTLSQVVSAAKALARGDWEPTTEVLAEAVRSALDEGLLIVASDTLPPHEPRLAISQTGACRLCALLRRPVSAGNGAVVRAATALKICFLRALDGESGCQVLDDLSQARRGDLEALQKGRVSCPAARSYPRRWMDREIERIEQEVAWLEQLRADLRVGI